MTTAGWLILIPGILGAAALAWFTYFVREPRGRGRLLLAVLRALALILILLLLVDPHLRAPVRRGGGTRVILDASLSMLLPGENTNAWQRGVAAARSARGDGRALLAGADVRAVANDSIDKLQPFAGESRLLPALQSAAESGADRVVLITDGAIDDAAEVARWLPTLGITLDVQDVGGRVSTNRAIRDVTAPAWAEAGKPLTLRVEAVTAGVTGSANVVVRQNGNVVANGDIALSETGAGTLDLTFNANGPAQGGLVRYDVAFNGSDAVPDDDLRSVYVFISEKPAGVAVVSFDPDWEPRFLHPVLADALGLPVRTFLRTPLGIYLRGGSGEDAGGKVDEAVVRRAVSEADLLVVHGFGSGAPQWAQEAVTRARRVIIFPADEGGQQPLRASAAVEGDWYVSADVPASPIASLLAGIAFEDLTPLISLHTAEEPAGSWAPLLAGRTRRGGRAPIVLAGEQNGRRWVLALAHGYWRWAFKGGAQRDAYTRLFGALAGWTVQDQAQVAGAAIRPLERAVPRATAIRWIAPGIAADSLVVTLRSAAGDTARVVMSPEPGDTAVMAAPEPGHYSYEARAFADGSEIGRANGPLTVERYSPEFIRRPAALASLKNAPSALNGADRAEGRALHTFSWLYVLIVLLLCAEWVLRRRWGLR